MSDSLKWKSKLLSSSVPLEYEVAKMLTSSGFSVESDYSYARDDLGVTKDFSVDILATGYPPFRSNSYNATIQLLIECKHRHRANKWLFFPDPNKDEMSQFTLGQTIRATDNFSGKYFKPNCTVAFDESVVCCMKGVEVDTSTGNVYESEIKHGLTQLQYGLPRLLSDNISFNLSNHEDDNLPFLFCPILLTTSEVLVAKSDLSIEAVEAASELEDIAAPAKYVLLYMDSTPDFRRHRRLACGELASLAKHPKVQNLDATRRSQGEYEFQLPSAQCLELGTSVEGKFSEYFSHIVVCSFEHFPELIDDIKTTVNQAVKSMKKPRKERTK